MPLLPASQYTRSQLCALLTRLLRHCFQFEFLPLWGQQGLTPPAFSLLALTLLGSLLQMSWGPEPHGHSIHSYSSRSLHFSLLLCTVFTLCLLQTCLTNSFSFFWYWFSSFSYLLRQQLRHLSPKSVPWSPRRSWIVTSLFYRIICSLVS